MSWGYNRTLGSILKNLQPQIQFWFAGMLNSFPTMLNIIIRGARNMLYFTKKLIAEWLFPLQKLYSPFIHLLN